MAARAGPAELAARRDLRAFPKIYRDSAIGKVYLALAADIDAGIPTRDKAAAAREMRLCYLTLNQLSPPKMASDFVDNAQSGHQERLRLVGGSDGPG
jgi:hypothetical protein